MATTLGRKLTALFAEQAAILRRIFGLKQLLMHGSLTTIAQEVRVRAALDKEVEQFIDFDYAALSTLKTLLEVLASHESTSDLQKMHDSDVQNFVDQSSKLASKHRFEGLLDGFIWK